VDTVPLRTTAGPDGQARLLLPGSSVKGVLRSHAERITRTVRGLADLPESWLEQVNDERLGPVAVLFGSARAKAAGRRGALAVHDCQTRTAGERTITHVAIDRWTGGAAENLLFSVREPATADWESIRLSLDTRLVAGGAPEGEGPASQAQALALLLLVLRDLADGWLALGFGGTRGRGAISVSEVAFTGTGLPGPWAAMAGRTLAGLIDDPPEAVTTAFRAWAEGAAR
jgi:CRISPR/Cas system CSM-associated protein Csm3 (group 7 of RAMP superfamily)